MIPIRFLAHVTKYIIMLFINCGSLDASAVWEQGLSFG